MSIYFLIVDRLFFRGNLFNEGRSHFFPEKYSLSSIELTWDESFDHLGEVSLQQVETLIDICVHL